MQDLIFAGTRERKPLGMAEVTLTMIDPEAYEGPVPVSRRSSGRSRGTGGLG
jgi:chromosome segregation protein